MSASLNGASRVVSLACVLSSKSCNVLFRPVSFGNQARDGSHVVDFFTLRVHREVQMYSCCRCAANLYSAVDGGLEEYWGLRSSRFGRFGRCSKLDAALRWKRGARIGSGSHGRWRSRFAARCGSAGSGGEAGTESSAAVLDVYLIRELLPPLVLGTVAFTVLGVSIGVGPEVMALAEKLGFSFRCCVLYAQIVFLRLPTYISLALPMASLLASMLAFGRLGVDSEVTALRAAGIGNLRMLRPTFILFMGITALHLLLAELFHRV